MFKQKINKLLIGTNNNGKLREIKSLLPKRIKIYSTKEFNLKSPTENGKTFKENSLIKSKYFSKKSGLPCLADDSGLEIDFLNKNPGIYSARWGGKHGDFSRAIKKSKKDKTIIAGLIEKNILKNKIISIKKKNYYNLDKEVFYLNLLKNLKLKDLVVSSTGYNSRELFFYRKKYKINKGKDFYLVGGMGHTSSLSLGININKKNHRVICLDGDGSFLMHMGAILTLANSANQNLKYILINNNLHDSVGGQTTYINKLDIKKLVMSAGFKNYFLIKSEKNIKDKIKNFLDDKSLSFLEVKTSANKIKDLPRPKNLKIIKNKFLK